MKRDVRLKFVRLASFCNKTLFIGIAINESKKGVFNYGTANHQR